MSVARGVVNHGLPIELQITNSDAILLASLLLSPARTGGPSSFAFVPSKMNGAMSSLLLSKRSAIYLGNITDLPELLKAMLKRSMEEV